MSSILLPLLAAKKGSRFAIHNAIRKYGAENFEVVVLDESAMNLVELNALERHYIKINGTLAPNGYNLTSGGEGTPGRSYSASEETRKKLSKATKGRILSPIHKKRIGDANRGKEHGPMPEATRKKLAIAHKDRVFTEEHRKKISESQKETWTNPGIRSNRTSHQNRNFIHVDLTENKFGNWTVRWPVGRGSDGRVRWLCSCDCGQFKIVNANLLRLGRSKSCGCLARKLARLRCINDPPRLKTGKVA